MLAATRRAALRWLAPRMGVLLGAAGPRSRLVQAAGHRGGRWGAVGRPAGPELDDHASGSAINRPPDWSQAAFMGTAGRSSHLSPLWC